VVILLGAVALAAAPASSPATGPTTRQRVTFTDPNPLAGLAEYCRRTRQLPAAYEREGKEHEYALADESFEIVVPAACGADNPHGLLVWVSPGRADVPREWLDVLARRKLIWICPNNAGNKRHFLVRLGFALDAVHNAKQKYAVDTTRIYVAGFSGGGRVASIAALTYPDVFTGALPMMGSNFYRPLPAGDGKFFQAGAARPIDRVLVQAKQRPMVLLTGERDGNRAQTKANFEAMQKERFTRVGYVEVPAIGHDMPTAEWVDKALTQLDAAAAEAAADNLKKRPTTVPATRGAR
jgi:poly(3-hydroxybutyrate) depolymerase